MGLRPAASGKPTDVPHRSGARLPLLRADGQRGAGAHDEGEHHQEGEHERISKESNETATI